jgi:hypothetical protein
VFLVTQSRAFTSDSRNCCLPAAPSSPFYQKILATAGIGRHLRYGPHFSAHEPAHRSINNSRAPRFPCFFFLQLFPNSSTFALLYPSQSCIPSSPFLPSLLSFVYFIPLYPSLLVSLPHPHPSLLDSWRSSLGDCRWMTDDTPVFSTTGDCLWLVVAG